MAKCFGQEGTNIWDEPKFDTSSCYLPLFYLFDLSKRIALVEHQILGKMDPKDTPSVSQQVEGHTTASKRSTRRDGGDRGSDDPELPYYDPYDKNASWQLSEDVAARHGDAKVSQHLPQSKRILIYS